MSLKTPWKNQSTVFNGLIQRNPLDIPGTNAPKSLNHDDCLRIALCYRTGYGTTPDNVKMLQYLCKAAEENNVAKMVYHRIASSLSSVKMEEMSCDAGMSAIDHELEKEAENQMYFAKRVSLHQQHSKSEGTCPPDYDSLNHSQALCLACQMGDAAKAMELCLKRIPCNFHELQPTPVHWLITFNNTDAEMLANALTEGDASCRDLLNTCAIAGRSIVSLPEHSLYLGGTPLHWAVQARNLGLVKHLIKLGANRHVQWAIPRRTSADGCSRMLTPLDVAVQLHLPEIVEVLLDRAANGPKKSAIIPHSPFHCIGLPCVPFARQLIHGSGYRQALSDTIRVLVSHQLSINQMTPEGYSPLMVALRDADCDDYIIQALLDAGALPTQTTNNGENVLILATQGCISRRENVACLRRLASVAGTLINALDGYGRGVLHYAAVANSAAAVRILATIEGFDVNLKAFSGLHPIHFAALFNSIDVIPILNEEGAAIDAPTETHEAGKTLRHCPLMIGTLRRNLEVVEYLLLHGANPDFGFLGSPLVPNILHAACANADSDTTLLPHLLREHKSLSPGALLHATDDAGWTPLHKAAVYGDAEGVRALLSHGADRALLASGKTALALVTDRLNREWAPERVLRRGKLGKPHFKASLTYIQELLRI